MLSLSQDVLPGSGCSSGMHEYSQGFGGFYCVRSSRAQLDICF